jgi:2-hydroxyacyl-CoA lyase 1
VAKISGHQIIAKALKQQGVENMYGVVGIPVAIIAGSAQREGINYVGMRHEMPATYAAQASSYLGGRIGVSLVVSGPGALNAVGAFANAWSNRWPLLMLGGAGEASGVDMGFFQEAEQVAAMAPYAKYSKRAESVERLPIYIAEAIKKSIMGVPGPSYIDLPGDIITGEVDEEKVQWAPRVPDPPRVMSDPADVRAAIEALKTAEQPLIIFGKGIASARAEAEMRRFVEATGIPYLAMPMAKGIIPDDHEQGAAAARSFVLSNADLIFLAGARLNWMLHFGLPPRFRPDVRVVQLDFNPEEIGVNVHSEVAMVGDAKKTLGQLLDVLDEEPWQFPQDSEWLQSVKAEARQNTEAVEAMYADHSTPLQYYPALKSIDDALPNDAIIVSEGASTMDISRTVLNNYEARTRLDAGSFGSMGLGHGFAVAAQVEHPDRRVLCLQGDGAFGFAGTECEVAVRYNLPITWVVFNNGGIGGHTIAQIESGTVPPGAMLPTARYDIMMEGLGGKGYNAETIEELDAALKEALTLDRPSLINVPIAADAKRKPQKFGWLTRTTD